MRLLRWLHTMEWIVSLYDWAKDKIVWLAGLIPVGAGVMCWQDIAPWLATILITGGWIVLLADHFIRRRKVPAVADTVPGDREGLKMAKKFYKIRKHQFDTWDEAREGVAARNADFHVLFHEFRGMLEGLGKECSPDPDHSDFDQWLLDYIERESARS